MIVRLETGPVLERTHTRSAEFRLWNMEIFQLNIFLMRCLFLWPLEGFSDTVNSLIRFTYIVSMTIVGGSVATWGVLRQTWHNFENLNVINESLAAVGVFYGHLFMYYVFNGSIKTIQKLVNDVNNFAEFSGMELIEEVEKKITQYTKLAYIYYSSAVTINVLLPLFDMEGCDRRQPNDEYRRHDPCGFSSRNWFPFEVVGPVTYPLVFATYTVCCLSVPLRGLAMSAVLISLLTHVLAQIEHCRKQIDTIFDGEDVNEMEKKLKFCIRHHVAIIDFSNRINAVFSNMMVLHMSLTSFVISVICYQLIIIESYIHKIRHFMHMCGWILLLFTACFFGQHLIDDSESLADAIYITKWYAAPTHLQKTTALVTMRAQHPLTLTAASLGIMSFPTFMSVMKGAYSYMTILFTMLEDDEE